MIFRSARNTIATCLALLFLTVSSPASAEELRIGGTGVALGGIRILADAFEKQNPGVTVEVLPSLGSSGGVKALIAGAIDLSVSSRALKDKEKEQGAQARVYAKTPLAMVTSTGTQTDMITTEQLAEMYAGTMTNWPSGERVRVILRPMSEIDVHILSSLSLDMAQAVEMAQHRPVLVMATNDQNNAEVLESLEGSIGAVALGQIATEGRRLKVLALDGIVPKAAGPTDPSVGSTQENREAIQRSMKLAKSLYLVRLSGTSGTAESFLDFVFSPQGRAILQFYDHSVPG